MVNRRRSPGKRGVMGVEVQIIEGVFMKLKLLLCCAVLALGACSRGEDPSALFDSDGNPIGDVGGVLQAGATSGSVIGPDGQPIEINSVQYFNQIIGDRVFFATDETSLSPSARAVLDQQAAWLLVRPSLAVQIEGHADEQGTREYNFSLSARRASAVRDYLVTKGVADSRLSTIPFGKERPIEVCSSETCWSQNRRAVTVVTGSLGA